MAHEQYADMIQQDAAEFITHLCNNSIILHDILQHDLIVTFKCPDCNETTVSTSTPNFILPLALPTNKEFLVYRKLLTII